MPGTDQGGTGGADDPFGILGTVLEKRYRLDAVVGEGGFGVVYRALHLGFDAPVAVKVLKLPPGLGTEARQKFLKSFANEGRLLFDLGKLHPGFRQVSDTGVAEAEGRVLPFLVQEWLEGQTLRDDLLGRRAQGLSGRPLAEVVQLLDPVARALAVAHGHKVAHRDVKPANVFLAKRDGSVTAKLLDFGVAKVMAATGPAALRDPTKDGLAAFSMEYAAPEQWMRKYGATGPWTDVYALALICVELLTERPALDGDDYQQLLGATLDPERPTPNRRGASVPEAVERLFAAALAIDPGTRPRHAGEFWDELVEKAGFGQASRDEQQTCRDVASTTPHRLAPTVPAEPFQVAGGGQQQQATVLASPEELPQVRTTPQFPAIGSDAGAAGAGPSPRSARPNVQGSARGASAAEHGRSRPRALSRWWWPAAAMVAAAGIVSGLALADRGCDAPAAPAGPSTRAPLRGEPIPAPVETATQVVTPPAPQGQPAQPGYQPPVQPAPSTPTETARPTWPEECGQARPLPPGAAAAAGPMLTALAQREVAGMKPEGWAPAGEFQQGQCHEHPFQLQPGRCYAAVGVGMGITEFDLEIAMQQAPYLKVRDRTRGSQPVLGGTMNCIRTPLLFGSPAKLILKATAGSGMGVAQLYSR